MPCRKANQCLDNKGEGNEVFDSLPRILSQTQMLRKKLLVFIHLHRVNDESRLSRSELHNFSSMQLVLIALQWAVH